MKTAISLPDELFEQAEEFASERGMSRSELYARALREYLRERRRDDLTNRIDRVCESVDTALPEDLAEHTRRTLRDVEW